jgi:TolB-like protein
MTSKSENNHNLVATGQQLRARLQLIGPFALEIEGSGFVELSSKKNRALLAILALSPGQRATRERLWGLLWCDRDEEQARSSLRQSLAVLRRELGPAEPLVLARQDDVLSLRTDTLSVDVLDLRRFSQSVGLDDLRRAAELFGGELLADTTIRLEGFDDWLAAERRGLTETAVTVLERLAKAETGAPAVAAARRFLSLDPLRESAHRLLMKALFSVGERALALQQYEACRAILKAEIDVEPAPETESLREEIAKAASSDHRASAPPIPHKVSGDEEARRASIAVLPFTNLADDKEQQYFADGLTEDLITSLAQQPGYFVIAKESSFAFRNLTNELSEIASKLGVRHILQGSLRQSGGRLRVNAHLVDTKTHSHVWAERFDREMTDIFATQDEIVHRIVEALTGRMPPGEARDRYRPTSLEAYDLCMRGRNEWRHSDGAGVRASPLFEQAIAIDPQYSEAYRWLAQCQCIGWLHYGWPIEPFRAEALKNARKSVACDPHDPTAHATLALVLMYERHWEEAEAEFKVALSLNPNDADSWMNLSDLRVMQGRGEEAVKCSERSILNSPQPTSAYWLMGQAQIAAGQYTAAVDTLMRPETRRSGAQRFLAAALALLGRIDEAQLEGRMFMAANPHFRISHWIASQPFQDQKMMERFVTAYHLAGLPD